MRLFYCSPAGIAGPASSGAVRYQRQRLFRSLEDNPFTGEPRPELDAAYARLLEPIVTRITPEEYEESDLGFPTLRLKAGDGYVGELSVFHELHCIKRVRRHLALERYYPNLTEGEKQREDIHTGAS